MAIDQKLEVVTIPVKDIDQSKDFYTRLGWRLDADISIGDQFQVVQVTPPGSLCSVQFGKGLTTAAPGSAAGIFLVVSDIEAARAEISRRGVKVSEPFHREISGPDTSDPNAPGLDPERRSYLSLATFSDPDGNSWLLQEITQRWPGRVDAPTTFFSVSDLAAALRRAEAAHGRHEARLGKRDENWPEWYAEFLIREQSGEEQAA